MCKDKLKLILLPGLDGTGLLFKPFLRSLPPHIEAVVVTYPPDIPLGYDELLPLALGALSKDEPFVLLGESFGGPLALQVAATRPAGLRSMVLCASFVTCPYGLLPPFAAHLIPAAPFRFMPWISRIRSIIGGYANTEVARLSVEALSTVTPPVWAKRVREIFRVDVRRELADCPVPLLYLQGTRDHVVPASNLQRIQQIRPDVVTTRVPSPHLLLQSCPEEAAAAIASFIERSCTQAS